MENAVKQEDAQGEISGNTPEMALDKFLAEGPIGRPVHVPDMFGEYNTSRLVLNLPEITLFCTEKPCEGDRIFNAGPNQVIIDRNGMRREFVLYQCKNCERGFKWYALLLFSNGDLSGTVVKVGEWPPGGRPLPSRLISLVGPDREAFLMGWRAEREGMGIGAFAYYRRVVENQKGRLLEKILAASERLGAPKASLDILREAQKERQFAKAVEAMKGALPESIRVNGHNPLQLLHSALSEGLHAGTDSECLTLATSIRLVLTDLAERIGQALREQADLNAAVSQLLARQQPSAGIQARPATDSAQ